MFLTLGVIYFVFMLFGAFLVRVPAEAGSPPGYDPPTVKKKALITSENVSAGNAIKTPQFWLLWVVLCCNVTAGIGILEQACADDPGDVPRRRTARVAAAAAAGFVGLLSLFNMGGRFVWSSMSDHIGRKPTYMIFFGLGMVLYFLLATVGQQPRPGCSCSSPRSS